MTAVWDGGRDVWRASVTTLIPSALSRIELATGSGDATLRLTRLGDDVGEASAG